jgi:hypothetical protein
MREVSAHAQNDDRSVAAEIFSVGTYFPNTPRIIQDWSIHVNHVSWADTLRNKQFFLCSSVELSTLQHSRTDQIKCIISQLQPA